MIYIYLTYICIYDIYQDDGDIYDDMHIKGNQIDMIL